MKKILTLIGVAALALATVFTTTKASAQSAEQTFALPSVIAVANSPTNLATPVVIDCRKQDKVAFFLSVSSADASSTTNVTFKGAWSADGATTNSWLTADTNNAVTLTASVNGGRILMTASNTLSATGRGYFIIYQESIGANSQITNNRDSYWIKIQAP